MPVELLNPDGLFKPDSYFQVGIGTGKRLVFLSGQVAQDQSGQIIGANDLAAQTEQIYLNISEHVRKQPN